MYLHFNNRRAKCVRKHDAGSKGEYYWTWQVYSEEGDHTLLHQGFSSGCEIDDGYWFRNGQQRKLNDPKFTVELPELTDDEEHRVVADIFCWESDHSTTEVKKAFTNKAMEKLWSIYQKHEGKKKKALADFEDWLDSSHSDKFLDQFVALASSAGAVMPYVQLAKAAIPLVKMGVGLVRSNSDDYLGFNRVELFYRRKGSGHRYRWLVNDGIENDYGAQRKPYYMNLIFESGDGRNKVATKSFFQVILDPTKPPA